MSLLEIEFDYELINMSTYYYNPYIKRYESALTPYDIVFKLLPSGKYQAFHINTAENDFKKIMREQGQHPLCS